MVRDHKFPEEYPFGVDGGATYLEEALTKCPEFPEDLGLVKHYLKECFDQILCYLLPHPGQKVADRNSFKGYVKGDCYFK